MSSTKSALGMSTCVYCGYKCGCRCTAPHAKFLFMVVRAGVPLHRPVATLFAQSKSPRGNHSSGPFENGRFKGIVP